MIGSIPTEVKDYLSYNPDTGIFTWLKRPHAKSHIRAGDVAGGISNGYVTIRFKGVLYYAHRLAFFFMGENVPELVDHEFGDTTDNRWRHIRPATIKQNANNTKLSKANTSGYKGVCYCKQTGKWVAQVDGYIGRYDTPEEAFAQTVSYRKENHKNFSNNG